MKLVITHPLHAEQAHQGAEHLESQGEEVTVRLDRYAPVGAIYVLDPDYLRPLPWSWAA